MRSRLLILISLCAAITAPAMAGDLNPPAGPVGPTMKPIVQLEARTPVTTDTTPGDADNLYIIDKSGSYYLLENIAGAGGKSGIKIAASNVTLDLNGFVLDGGDAGHHGIVAGTGIVNFRIMNGTVRGWTANGAALGGVAYVRMCDLMFHENGSTGAALGRSPIVESSIFDMNGGTGLICNANAVIRDCSFSFNDGDGVFCLTSATINTCTASNNTRNGIRINSNGVVQNCSVSANAEEGILLNSSGTVANCASRQNDRNGIAADDGAVVTGCSVPDNSLSGLTIDGGTLATQCSARDNGLHGVHIIGLSMLTQSIMTENSSTGATAEADESFIHRNACMLNGSDEMTILGSRNYVDSNWLNNGSSGPGDMIDVDGIGNIMTRNFGRLFHSAGPTNAGFFDVGQGGGGSDHILRDFDPFANVLY